MKTTEETCASYPCVLLQFIVPV